MKTRGYGEYVRTISPNPTILRDGDSTFLIFFLCAVHFSHVLIRKEVFLL